MKAKSIYILLTPRCNLRCRYCFQPKEYRAQRHARVSLRVIDAFVAYCIRSRVHHVEVFGGEPLLCKPEFCHLVKSLRRTLPDTSLGVVTNGTLIDDAVMGLIEAESISVLLSLDGRQERHDALRGGFDQISLWLPRLAATGRATVALQAGLIPGLYDSVRYVWGQGFKHGVYVNVVQSYGWYSEEDVRLFEGEYERCVQGMLRGEGRLLCTRHLHEMLEKPHSQQECGITANGLACDWLGRLYPCHRAMELGPRFAIGDIRAGVDGHRSRRLRARIRRAAFGSESAKKYPIVSYCPVDVYQEHSTFAGQWPPEFCQMIEAKAKLVAKYHYELADYFRSEVWPEEAGPRLASPAAPLS